MVVDEEAAGKQANPVQSGRPKAGDNQAVVRADIGRVLPGAREVHAKADAAGHRLPGRDDQILKFFFINCFL